MKLTELLTERVSDVVYRLVPLTVALTNLKTNMFQLTLSVPNRAGDYMHQKEKLYFLSLSRTPNNIYFKEELKLNSVIFVLDGRKLSQNYKGVPVNYFNRSKSDTERFEAEDRIISNDPFIPNAAKYIKEIHVRVSVGSITVQKLIKGLEILVKQRNIKAYYYDAGTVSKQKFLTLNKSYADDLNYIANIDYVDAKDAAYDDSSLKNYENSIAYQMLKFYESGFNTSFIVNKQLAENLEECGKRFKVKDITDVRFDMIIINIEELFHGDARDYRKQPEYSKILAKISKIYRRHHLKNMKEFIKFIAVKYYEAL